MTNLSDPVPGTAAANLAREFVRVDKLGMSFKTKKGPFVAIRDIDLTRRDTVLRAIDSACDGVIERRGVRVKKEMLNADPPAQSSRRAVDILTQSCQAFGIPSLQMVSRAYHDSLFMSRITEFAMLFIRCREGISHRPDEYASPEDIATGTKVLAQALAQLSSL